MTVPSSTATEGAGLIERLRAYIPLEGQEGLAVRDKLRREAAYWIEQLERENLVLRYDLDQAIANHTADLSVPSETAGTNNGRPSAPDAISGKPASAGGQASSSGGRDSSTVAHQSECGNYDPQESPEALAERLKKIEAFVAECNGESVLSAERGATEKAVDAALAFAKDLTYLSHPKVRPYRGTENGDSSEAWERDYGAELCRVILAAVAPSAPSSARLTEVIGDAVLMGEVEIPDIGLKTSLGLVLKFGSKEDVRQAIKNQRCAFTVFGEKPLASESFVPSATAPTSEGLDAWDVRGWWGAVQHSGVPISHEDGWTLIATEQLQDKQRLDWMERHLCRAGEVKNAAAHTVKLCRVWSIMGELETLRETVDAAMASNPDRDRSPL